MTAAKKKLLHHGHSGRLRPHHHTSFAGLGFLLLVVTLLMMIVTVSTLADEQVNVRATVNGPVPENAPVITSPSPEQIFYDAVITAGGSCTSGYLVKMFVNNLEAGATTCGPDQRFSLSISLVPGSNQLIAQQFNYAEQTGPESTPVTVELRPRPQPTPSPGKPAAPNPPPSPGEAVILVPDKLFQGILINEQASWNIEIVGGSAPFKVEWNWADGDKDLISYPDRSLNFKHTYLKAGEYRIFIRITDARGRVAAMQLVAIVRDMSVAQTVDTRPLDGNLSIAWPILIVTLMFYLSFWLGEKHEIGYLRGHPAQERRIIHS